MLITIDNRERKRIEDLEDYYTQYDDCEVEVTTLATGDLIFTKNNNSVVYEYKTVPDFIASIKDHRVFNQSIDMYNEYDYHYVIIVGSDDEISEHLYMDGLHEHAYYGAILQLNTYTTVLTAPYPELAYYMMYNLACKCLEDNLIYKRLPVKTPNPAQNLLLSCKGLGLETVELIKDTLNVYSFKDLAGLSYDDLVSVKGIGDKTAKLILEYIGSNIE